MFIYDKKLQYPVKIDKPNPRLAAIIISQYGGPDGELGASLRYLSQRYSMPFDEPKNTGYRRKNVCKQEQACRSLLFADSVIIHHKNPETSWFPAFSVHTAPFP